MGRREKRENDKKKTKETKKTKDEHISATGDQPEGLIQILFNHFRLICLLCLIRLLLSLQKASNKK